MRLEFFDPAATTACVAGSFNDWRPDATPMISLGNGRWVKELVLPSGDYEYCLVVDGEWMPDPLAKETVRNPFGGLNAVLRVPASCDQTAAKTSVRQDRACANLHRSLSG